jgi:hypothetical protein
VGTEEGANAGTFAALQLKDDNPERIGPYKSRKASREDLRGDLGSNA